MGLVTVTISKQWIQKWERRPQCPVNSSNPMKAKIVCVGAGDSWWGKRVCWEMTTCEIDSEEKDV